MRVLGWWRAAIAMACAAQLWGCGGEIERAELAIVPSPEDFNSAIQPLLIEMGCSFEGGCHDVGLGGVTIKVGTGPAALEESYLSVKAQLDREDPGASRIIQSVLTENTQATHRPAACIDLDSCAYQKLVAWISDASPQAVDCDPTPDGCYKSR